MESEERSVASAAAHRACTLTYRSVLSRRVVGV